MAIIALLYSLYTQGWKEILKLMDISSTEKRLTEDEKKAHQSKASGLVA